MASEQDEQALVERWEERQGQLKARLAALDVAEGRRELLWEEGRVRWLGPSGAPAALAEMRALCSFDVERGALLMAWAHAEEGQPAIEPVADVPDSVEPSDEGEAWLWAMRLAEASGAEYLSTLSSPGYLVFLGLWALRDPAEGVAREPGSALGVVVGTLESLLSTLRSQPRDASVLRDRFLNEADALRDASFTLAAAGLDEALLERTCDRLERLAASFPGRRFGLLPSTLPPADTLAEVEESLRTLRSEWLRQGGP